MINLNLKNKCVCTVFKISLLWLILLPGTIRAQDKYSRLHAIVSAIDTLNTRVPEKVFVHFDKPYYFLNDTIWFKAYLLDARFLHSVSNSGLLYIELSNDSNRVVKRVVSPVSEGLSWGNIALLDKEFTEGAYTLRAYTNWMRNFGEDYVFKRQFYIHSNTRQIAEYSEKPVARNVSQPGETNRSSIVPYKKTNEPVDLQFLPEGGNLVGGIIAHVGFKAINENGKGEEVSGKIYNMERQEVAVFHSTHNGMGVFDFIPLYGEHYTAKVLSPKGAEHNYLLPPVYQSGIAIKVNNPIASDSISVDLYASRDVVNLTDNYYLVGLAHTVICYTAIVNLGKGHLAVRIPKNLFPSGVAHITLFNAQRIPLVERQAYIRHEDDLKINISADKKSYLTRDSVSLTINVTDKNGQLIAGDFSAAVTDNNQVKPDSLDKNSIVTNLLFTSDIKGYVEEPDYYFGQDKDAWQNLDNLLLTQGWIGYDWNKFFISPKVKYQHETGLIVKGRITNAFSRPMANTTVTLFCKKPLLLMDTKTDKTGRFVFKDFPELDTAVFFIQAKNAVNQDVNANFEIEQFIPPAFSKYPNHLQWAVAADTAQLKYSNNIKQQYDNPNITGIHKLNEIVITGKKVIKASKNLNGPGNADQVLDEKDLEAEGKKNLFQVLEDRVKGFRLRGWVKSPTIWYFVNDNWAEILIDGVLLTPQFGITYNEDLRSFLERYPAEDIKGIEVMAGTKYNHAYNVQNKPWLSRDPDFGIKYDYAYIEITTRSGNGPYIGNRKSSYLYRPLPVSWPKQFYNPKYQADTTTLARDFRPTIYWQPNLVTNKKGEAKLGFYAADLPSTYTITIQGTDMNGYFGFKTSTIDVFKK